MSKRKVAKLHEGTYLFGKMMKYWSDEARTKAPSNPKFGKMKRRIMKEET